MAFRARKVMMMVVGFAKPKGMRAVGELDTV
jgi:hypothetical protein